MPELFHTWCKKNPGHPSFIPVNEFTEHHVPSSLQNKESMDSIHCMVNRTVKVVVGYTSIARPETFPSSRSPYPFHTVGGTRRIRCGTGFLENDFRLIKGMECPCPECSKSGNPATKFWEFVVSTTTVVVFDESEALNTRFMFFYDTQGIDTTEYLYGTTTLGKSNDLDDLERILTDHTKVACVTHDLDLSDRLIKILERPIDLASNSTGIIISHPHGSSKHITVGNFLGVGFHFLYKRENVVRFGPGMDDTEINLLKEALFVTKSSELLRKVDEDSDVSVHLTSNLLPESFILDANVDFPQFSSVDGNNVDESETKWCKFPVGTRFLTKDKKIISVPEGMDVDVDALYCYLVYDIDTCPGSSGARVIYRGEHFHHSGSFTPVNLSGFIKASECALIGTIGDDAVSVGASSLDDEGFSEYAADVEMMGCDESFDDAIETDVQNLELNLGIKIRKPQIMLNDKVFEYLDKIDTSFKETASHEDLYYHIQSYVEEESSMFPDRYSFKTRSELKEILTQLIFKKYFAADAVNSIPEEILLSQEASYWGLRYLEDSQPGDQDGPYLYNTACRDTWFEYVIDLPRQYRGEGSGGPRKTVKIYNVEKNQIDNTDIETNSNFSYHYHGTNVSSARMILRIGIDLNKGKPRRDYSDGHGFYVSRDYYQASNWARRGHGFPVVVVFRTQNDFFSDINRHIHLRATDLDTLAILKHFRSGCMEEIDTIEKIDNPTLDECDSINGPILFDLNGFRNGEGLVLKSHQTCIRKQNCANSFYTHLDCIVFNP